MDTPARIIVAVPKKTHFGPPTNRPPINPEHRRWNGATPTLDWSDTITKKENQQHIQNTPLTTAVLDTSGRIRHESKLTKSQTNRQCFRTQQSTRKRATHVDSNNTLPLTQNSSSGADGAEPNWRRRTLHTDGHKSSTAGDTSSPDLPEDIGIEAGVVEEVEEAQNTSFNGGNDPKNDVVDSLEATMEDMPHSTHVDAVTEPDHELANVVGDSVLDAVGNQVPDIVGLQEMNQQMAEIVSLIIPQDPALLENVQKLMQSPPGSYSV
ncbi:hypothetical protein LOK49_LG07G01261 [Camellia lanceoleosa]|uniref:Uncharacterized protein n=1 Tax=Camellia lanceoleosa TaxID=1840588 RepID=A0ACC0GZB1_9ERIC|nr:hypothetical protein LOK49_LG07G01261 [Camellia lanceoleosa]